MKKIFIASLLFVMGTRLFAQGVDFQWAKALQFSTTGQRGSHFVAVDAIGNVYSAGTYYTPDTDFDPGPGVFNLPPNGQDDIFITKYNSSGDFIWVVNLGGLKQDYLTGLFVDAAGYIYTTGLFKETADFDPGPGVYNLSCSGAFGDADVFISQLDPNGNFVWAKQIGGSGTEYARSIVVDGIGNIYTTGSFSGSTDFDPGPAVYNLPSAGGSTFILKLDNAGNFAWAKSTYNSNYFGEDYTMSIAVDPLNNVYFAGSFTGTLDFDPGPGTFVLTSPAGRSSTVTKLDQNGNFGWAVIAGPTIFYSSHSIATDANGNTFLTTEQRVSKINNTGNLLWTKNIGGSVYDNSKSICTDGNGNIYLCGQFWNTVDFDPGPAVHNLTAFGPPSTHDAFILRLDNNGNFIWVQQIGGIWEDIGYSLYVDPVGDIFHTGAFTFTADFDPGPSVYSMSANGTSNYIHKMNKCLNTTTSVINTTACFTYTLNGQTYTSTGVYTQTILNAAGCDSIITLNLVIAGTNTTSSLTACDSYTWQGNTYTTSGIYRDTLISSSGCDSILNLNLTIKYSIQSTVNATICQGQIYAGHATTGTYVDIYAAANGCDSIRTLNLTVTPVLYSNITATICNNQNYAGHNTSGIYIDTLVSLFGCDSIRTLTLTVNARAFTNINASICEGQSYYAGGANQTTSGIYRDTLLTSLGCDSMIITTLVINPKPKPDLGADRNLCADGNQASISPGFFAGYLWQDNSMQPNLLVRTIGSYWVIVTDINNCSGTDTVNIVSIDTVPKNFLPNDQTICYGNEVKISLPGYREYFWSTGATSSNVTIKDFGTFYLTVKDFNNCTGQDSIKIIRKNCIPIGIPNAFTPNGDNQNDIFKPTINQAIHRYQFIIFNRYGEVVFETREYGKGWDGNFKTKKQPNGTYVYRITFTNNFGWESVENGTVLLIR